MLKSYYSDSFLNQYCNNILKCIGCFLILEMSYIVINLFFPVNFEVQIQLHRLQASWFNLVNRLADDILLSVRFGRSMACRNVMHFKLVLDSLKNKLFSFSFWHQVMFAVSMTYFNFSRQLITVNSIIQGLVMQLKNNLYLWMPCFKILLQLPSLSRVPVCRQSVKIKHENKQKLSSSSKGVE